LVSAGWFAVDRLTRQHRTAKRRALDARAFELAANELVPGSRLLLGTNSVDRSAKASVLDPTKMAESDNGRARLVIET
jgi:hypothetical protein